MLNTKNCIQHVKKLHSLPTRPSTDCSFDSAVSLYFVSNKKLIKCSYIFWFGRSLYIQPNLESEALWHTTLHTTLYAMLLKIKYLLLVTSAWGILRGSTPRLLQTIVIIYSLVAGESNPTSLSNRDHKLCSLIDINVLVYVNSWHAVNMQNLCALWVFRDA